MAINVLRTYTVCVNKHLVLGDSVSQVIHFIDTIIQFNETLKQYTHPFFFDIKNYVYLRTPYELVKKYRQKHHAKFMSGNLHLASPLNFWLTKSEKF